MGSPSAWTARVPGATTSSSSGSGDRSSTRRSTSELTTRSPRPAPRSAGISASTTPADRIRALTGGRRIKPTSLACRRSRRPEPGRHSTYQAGKPVQTNQASSPLTHPGDQALERPAGGRLGAGYKRGGRGALGGADGFAKASLDAGTKGGTTAGAAVNQSVGAVHIVGVQP